MSPGKSPPGKGKMHLLDMMKVRSSRPFSLMIDLLHFYQGTSMGQNKLILDNLPKVGIKWRGQSVQSVSECSLSRRLSEGGSMSRRRYSTRWDLAPPGLGSECTRHAPDMHPILYASEMHPTCTRPTSDVASELGCMEVSSLLHVMARMVVTMLCQPLRHG